MTQHLVSRPPRSRFHVRLRRLHKDADSFADAITDLCLVGYPQSSPELRQEIISEQFVRGQSDPKLKKYLWVVIITQKDRKLQTLIEVCTSTNIHRPAEQVFAVEEDSESEEMFTMADRPQWTGQSSSDSTVPPLLEQMFALARKMGYEMRPIARQMDNTRQSSGSPRAPFTPGQGCRPTFRSGRDFSRIKCFSCGQFGHTQTRCPKPDSTLPYKPAVGTCSLIVNDTRTLLHCRETPFRLGPHPYRSEYNKSGLHFIFTTRSDIL